MQVFWVRNELKNWFGVNGSVLVPYISIISIEVVLLLDLRQNRVCMNACICHIMQKHDFAFYFSLSILEHLYSFLIFHLWPNMVVELNCQHTITNISAAIAACMHACNTAASTYLPRFIFQLKLKIW
jgi:hypothetical protein